MRIDVLTLFPDAVTNYAATSVLGRAKERGIWELRVHDFRVATTDVHRSVDDTPYGGGAGMVLSPEPLAVMIDATPDLPRPLIMMSPSGRPFTHAVAHHLSTLDGFTLLCGRYEGFDQRFIDAYVDDAISLGDFVLAGGELAALCVAEAVVRLVPGALGNDDSAREESFSDGLLEYPHYTKPARWRDADVPEVLLSGNHALIARWRRAQSLDRTRRQRPDLWELRRAERDEDLALLDEFGLVGEENS